ncbi:hypothetical protein NFI96_026719, partial [Prochilodus magdalenae]
MEKKTCPSTCRPRENCYYDWYSQSTHLGCSYGPSVWFYSTSLPVTCVVNDDAVPPQKCSLNYRFWGVTYTRDGVCALKGSSVDLSCSYKHPEGLRVTRSFWFIKGLSQKGVEPQDVREGGQYRGRVQYSRTPNPCTMTITDLRETDTQTYRFRFYTDDPGGRYTGEPGVSLTVTDLKITVSHTGGGGRWLTCSSTCTPSNPTYIWYRNGQPVLHQNRRELYLNSRTGDAGSYSCAVKGYENLHSPAVCVSDLQVKVEGPAVTESEGQTLTLTCTSTCTPSNPTYIWYRNGQPVSGCNSASCSVSVVSEAVSYSCAVTGSGLRSPPVYSPRNTRAVIQSSGQMVEGGSVTLTCSSDANPPVLTYRWFNQGSDVELGTGQNYTITSISSQHSGPYYCTAQNQLGQNRSGPSRLDVLYSPRTPSVSEAEFNGSVTLVCVSDSNPASSYTWFRKVGGNIRSFGEGASLTVAAGTDGVFYCRAENHLGSSNSSEWSSTPGTDNRTSTYTAAGVIVVLLLVFSGGFLWMRTTPKHDQHQNLLVPQRQSPSSSSACSSVSQRASGPVYDNILNLAMTSEPSGAAPSAGLDDVQYSTVQFTRSQMKEVPLYSSVQPKAAPQEEEVQYVAVNVKSKSRRA